MFSTESFKISASAVITGCADHYSRWYNSKPGSGVSGARIKEVCMCVGRVEECGLKIVINLEISLGVSRGLKNVNGYNNFLVICPHFRTKHYPPFMAVGESFPNCL